MRIELRPDARRPETIEIDVKKGTKIIEVVKEYGHLAPYPIIAAKRDNIFVELGASIKKDGKLEFLDIRSQAAYLIYQYSLILLYLKAMRDVIGPVQVEVDNSIVKSLYTLVHSPEPITSAQVRAVEKRMHELVAEDLPYVKKKIPIAEARALLVENAFTEKLKLLATTDARHVKCYQLGDYTDFFYGLMVPSTRFLYKFSLRKYKDGVLLRLPDIMQPDRIPPFRDDALMHRAFVEEKKWEALMGVSFVTELNSCITGGNYRDLVQLSEALQNRKIVEIAADITRKGRRIILIAGPSSSGKTTFAKRLCIQLRVNGLKPLYLGTDDYFINRADTPLGDDGKPDYENLSALDIDLFNRNMNDLLAGREVDIPQYNFIKGEKEFGRRKIAIGPDQPIVIEGIHALNDEMTPKISADEKYKIYISPLTMLNIDSHNRIPTTDARMLRRMARDYKYRGHSAQATIDMWPKVRAGEDKNIFPYCREADVLFNSAHIYEIAVLKKYVAPILEAVKEEEPEFGESRRLLKFLYFFDVLDDESVIPNNSILREFIGDSVFLD